MTQYTNPEIDKTLNRIGLGQSKPDQTNDTNNIQSSEIIGGIKSEAEQADPTQSLFETLRAANNRIKEAVISGKTIEVPVLMLRDGEPFFNINTINTVVAASGSLKSTFQNVLMACMLNKGSADYDFLNFTVHEEFRDKIKVFLFDTEQSETKVTQRVATITRGAGFKGDEYPSNFFVYPLSACSTKDRIEAVTNCIDQLGNAEGKGTHNIIFVDVVTDLTKDINDSKEAPDIVAQLQQLVNLKNVTLFVSIHKAKTTGIARGHIGTEITNKSTTILIITRMNSATKKDTAGESLPIYRMQTDKYREGKEQSSFEFTYNEANNLLRLPTSQEKENIHLQEKDQIKYLYAAFGLNKFTVTNSAKEIEPKLIEIFGEKKERSYNYSLDRLCEFGTVNTTDKNIPIAIQLQKTKIGRKTAYEFIEVNALHEQDSDE